MSESSVQAKSWPSQTSTPPLGTALFERLTEEGVVALDIGGWRRGCREDPDRRRRVGARRAERAYSQPASSIARLLSAYLDPATGSLPWRLEQLSKGDGEIDLLLAKDLVGGFG